MKKSHLFYLIIILIYSKAAIGQNNNEDTLKTHLFKPIMVTASRSEKQIEDIGKNVYVITKEEIENSAYTNVSDFLSNKAGVYIVGTQQNPGSIQSIFMRGTNSNQTVVMIDGIRITDPSSTNNAVDLSQLSTHNVEQIEVIKGTSSVLYGTGTIGGVVNIITKKGQKEGINILANIRSGNFGKNTSDLTTNLNTNYTFKNGFYIQAGVYNSLINGIDATVDTIKTRNRKITVDTIKTINRYEIIDQDNFKKTDLTASVGYNKNGISGFVGIRKINQKSDLDNGIFSDDYDYTIDLERKLIEYNIRFNKIKNLTLSINGGFSDNTRLSINDATIIDFIRTKENNNFKYKTKGSIFNNEFIAEYKNKNIRILTGLANYKEKKGLDLTYNVTIRSAFIQTELNGELINSNLSNLNLIVGGRINRHSIYGDNFVYEINPSYKISNHSLVYGLYSTGFNAPSLSQMYSSYGGNKKLNPETSTSYELGLKSKLIDKLNIQISAYSTTTSNVINYANLWYKSTPIESLNSKNGNGSKYLNSGIQTNKGIQFDLSYKWNKKLNTSIIISYVKSSLKSYKISDIESSIGSKNHVQLNTGIFLNNEEQNIQVIRRPTTIQFKADFKISKKLLIGSNIRYVAGRYDLNSIYLSDYTLLNLYSKYSINNLFFLTLQCDNVLNKTYSEIYGYQSKGFGIYFRLSFKFNR